MFTLSDHLNQRKCNPSIPGAEGICLASCWSCQQGVNVLNMGFKVSAGDHSISPGAISSRQACCMGISSLSVHPSLPLGNPEPEERREQLQTDTLQAAPVRIKLSWWHKCIFFSQQSFVHSLDVAEVNLAPGSCVGCSLCFHQEWVSGLWPSVPVMLIAFWLSSRNRGRILLGSLFLYVSFVPAVGPSLLVAHEFSACAAAASLTHFQPLLRNLISLVCSDGNCLLFFV